MENRQFNLPFLQNPNQHFLTAVLGPNEASIQSKSQEFFQYKKKKAVSIKEDELKEFGCKLQPLEKRSKVWKKSLQTRNLPGKKGM